jgi:hypothetical protein
VDGPGVKWARIFELNWSGKGWNILTELESNGLEVLIGDGIKGRNIWTELYVQWAAILGMKLESNWLDCLEWTGAKGLDYLVEAGVKWAGQIG